MVHYKLNYFNGRGRAELIRLIFAAADEKYEDYRFESDHWPELKAKTPFGNAPWLEIHQHGEFHVLAHANCIARYLARKFGLAGKHEIEAAEIDMYGDQITDIQNESISSLFETDDTRKKMLQDKLASETIPHNMKLFDDRLEKTGSGYIAHSGLSWVDLYLFTVLENLGDKKDAILSNYKHVKALEEKIKTNPRIAAWLAKRPKTPI